MGGEEGAPPPPAGQALSHPLPVTASWPLRSPSTSVLESVGTRQFSQASQLASSKAPGDL